MSKASFANRFLTSPGKVPKAAALLLGTALLSTPETGSLIEKVTSLVTSTEALPTTAACQPNVRYKSSLKDGVERANDINAGVDRFTVSLIGAPVTHNQIGLDFTFQPYDTRIDSEGAPVPETFPATAKVITIEGKDGTTTEELAVKADDAVHGIHGLVSADITITAGPYKGNEIHCGTTPYGSIDRENPNSPVKLSLEGPVAPAPTQPK